MITKDPLEAKGDEDEAIAEYREALRLDRSHFRAHARLGMLLDHTDNVDGAIAEYRQAVNLNPSDASVHYRLGRALRDKGDKQAALEELHKASSLEPQNATFRDAYQKVYVEGQR
jgi:tetratricopeptide (TPR) repeat protein